jgi:hypothetical protein
MNVLLLTDWSKSNFSLNLPCAYNRFWAISEFSLRKYRIEPVRFHVGTVDVVGWSGQPPASISAANPILFVSGSNSPAK